MSTRVRLPDGSYVTVPTTDKAKAAAAAQRYWANKQKAPARPQKPRTAASPKPKAKPKSEGGLWETYKGFVDTVSDANDKFVDNLLPNWGDELRGFGRGLRSLARGGSYMDGFEEGQASFKRDQARFSRERPNLSRAAAGTGMVASAALPAGNVARGASLAQKMRQAAAVGGAYGVASGAGQGEGIVERGTNAAKEGFIGTAVGAAIPGATQAAQNGGRWARRNLPGVDAAYRTATAIPSRLMRSVTGAPARSAGVEQADRLIGERMNQGNISNGLGQPGAPASPDAIAREVAQRNARGVPAMIGDVTEEMRGLTEYAGRGAGPGQSLVRRALEGRKANEGLRIRQHVQDTFPTTDDPIRYLEEAGERARREAAPLYDEAYAQPVFRTADIQAIERTPAFRQALGQAYNNIRNQIDPATGLPKNPREMGFREMVDVDPNGLPPNGPYFQAADGTWVSYERGLSTEGYDQVIRAMRDNARAAADVNPITGRVRDNSNSVHIGARARDLRSHLAGQNDAYADVTRRYGDQMALNDAFEQGGNFGNATGHEINAQLRAMPDFARETFTRGAGTSMADEATRYAARYPNGDTARRIRQMLGDDVKQGALAQAQGNPAGVRDLAERLEYEQQGNILYNRVNGNSATAQRQQLDADLDAGAGIPTSRDGIVSRIVTALADRARPQLQQDLKQRIAEVMTASDARTVQEVMEAIAAQAERDVSFRRLLQRANVGAAALYGSSMDDE
jgi:hypothetical protein